MRNDEVLADFKRRYEDTYVYVQMPDSKEENLFYMDRITACKTSVGIMSLSSEEYGKIQLNLGTAHTIKFKFPACGVFQHNEHALIFRRQPAKQYSRGLCAGNSLVRQAAHDIIAASNMPLSFSLVSNAFAGVVYSLKDAVRMLASGKFKSVALPDNYTLMLSTTTVPDYILLHWHRPVARIASTGSVTAVLEGAYKARIITMVNGQ